jgi:hypothetical protein
MASRKNNTSKPSQELDDMDVEHIAGALGRVKNPAVRYFLSMMIDALTEDLAEIEAGRPPRLLTRSRSN